MKISRNRTKIATIALILTLTIAATLVALPTVTAHDPPWDIPTWTYIAVCNDPIGVGQQQLIVFWVNEMPQTAAGAYGDRWTFYVDVTKPDGSKETLGPFKSDPVGGSYTLYTPDQVGAYTFVAKVSGGTYTGIPKNPALTDEQQRGYAYWGDIVKASESDPLSVTVQQEPIQSWQETPLPTEYWTRPINSANRDWCQVAANWLAGAAQNVGPTDRFSYGTGPESAHIMWATPMWAGGIADARFGNLGYATSHYEGLGFTPPIILNGKIYYNVQSLPREGWRVLDLYTGEELWFHNTTGPVTGNIASGSSSGRISGELLAFGQILNFECPNQHGAFPYLWSTNGPEPNTWMMFDAETGNYMCSIANVSAGGTAVYGKDGSILRYNIVGTGANKRLTVWNTTQAIWWKESWSGNQYWMWRPGLNVTYDGNNGFSLNVSIPDVQGRIREVREDLYVIGGTSGTNKPDKPLELGNLWALSLKPGEEGTLLWNITYTPPYDVAPSTSYVGMYRGQVYGPTVDPEDGMFTFFNSMTREHWGFSLETGEMIWGPTPPEAQMQYYGLMEKIYQGKLFSYGYAGVLTAYVVTTGEILWNYTASQESFESPYGNYPISIVCIADGKIYLVTGEHSPTQPLMRGSYLRCIDANTGTELWKLLLYGMGMGPRLNDSELYVVMADGYIVGLNLYDNQIYCLGKGPSATTVSAAPKTIAKGASVVIEGTVTDQSPGAKDTPAIADDDMTAWMEYKYAQQAIPADATGVEVTLDAIDPNGNFIHIGTTTSNMDGTYGYQWTPEIEGKYEIIATFEGSDSYYSSYATTYIGVDPAPSPAQPIEPEEPTEAPLITTEIAIIAAVAIAVVIGIVAYWALRKRRK